MCSLNSSNIEYLAIQCKKNLVDKKTQYNEGVCSSQIL
ncbi:hypothetical protein LEP1GSC074_1101 [Leptospira noguchii str. Hook]|nr:hypothetical protein LEP1GSC074_1101 [Leptospira noguchii str. Hook]